MRHRPASALMAALLCLGGLVATGAVALILPVAQAHDSASLSTFTALGGHTRVSELANLLAHSVDPIPYLALGLLLAGVALLRGRPRVALVVPLAMLAASASTELLKPLVDRPAQSDWLGSGSPIGAASWPSGHSTAAMMVALCAVLVAPRLLRPLAALLGTGLAVGVSYSILVLGWHFPSDVLGGFLVAGGWVAAALAGLWAAEARWPEPAARRPLEPAATHRLDQPSEPSDARRPEQPAEPAPHRPGAWARLGGDLLAPAPLLAASFAAAAAVLAVRGRLVETYGAAHLSFVAGALAIAGLAALLATGMAVALRRQS